jgi:hypothetical protein
MKRLPLAPFFLLVFSLSASMDAPPGKRFAYSFASKMKFNDTETIKPQKMSAILFSQAGCCITQDPAPGVPVKAERTFIRNKIQQSTL